MKRTITYLFLSILLVSCTPIAPRSLPTETAAPTVKVQFTQTDTYVPEPPPQASSTPLLRSTGVLERFAQAGGSISGITVVGDMAYVGMGPRVAAIDLSQPDHPRLVNQSEPLPGAVTQLISIDIEIGSFLLVGAGKYLALMETTLAEGFASARVLELPGAISAMLWDSQQGRLYVGGSSFHAPSRYSGFISAIVLNPDSQMRLIDSIDMPERPLSLALSSEGLFAGAEGYQGGLYYLQLVSKGMLSTPILVIASTPVEPFQPMSMQVIGDRLYLGYLGLHAYDITDPEQPERVWSAGGNIVRSFSLDGDQVFTFGWTILSEYVRHPILAPEPITGLPVGIPGSVTAVHKGNFLVAYDTLEIYQPIEPEGLRLLGSYSPPVIKAIGLCANEHAIFVVDQGIGFASTTSTLRMLNLPVLQPGGDVQLEYSTWNGFRSMALESDRLYLAANDSLSVYGVDDGAMEFLGQVEISGGGVETIAVMPDPERRMLAVAQQLADSSLIQAYDLTDLDTPALVGDPLPLEKGEILQLAWQEPALFAMRRPAFQSEQVMLDRVLFENESLTLGESLRVPGYAVAMAHAGDLIALAGSDVLSVISAKADEPLILLSQTALPEVGVGVAIHTDWVLVAVGGDHGAAQLLIFDIQDPALPEQESALDLPVSQLNAVPMLMRGPHLILANGFGGVEVLRLEP